MNGDIYGMISPYITANFWVRFPSLRNQRLVIVSLCFRYTDSQKWWPLNRKFHYRTYGVATENMTNQLGLQSTFSLTSSNAALALNVLNAGKTNQSYNILAENEFFRLWEAPNFHHKDTDEAITEWPVTGYNYDVLIGGLWPGQAAAWDYGIRGYTMELAFPVTQANAMLKRTRELFDFQFTENGINMTATYKTGINIKFGSPHYDFLGQVTYNTSDGADWSKGVIMLDFPTFRPTIGDQLRFNEPFCKPLSFELPHQSLSEVPRMEN